MSGGNSEVRYRLTIAADGDLDGIWQYTYEQWGAKQATKYLRQLKRRVVSLAKRPSQGKSRDEVSPGLRSDHEGRHLILYRGDRGAVIIIRVLHDRMDVPDRIIDDLE